MVIQLELEREAMEEVYAPEFGRAVQYVVLCPLLVSHANGVVYD